MSQQEDMGARPPSQAASVLTPEVQQTRSSVTLAARTNIILERILPAIWRWRVPLIGTLAALMALAGEWAMRKVQDPALASTGGDPAAWSRVGGILIWLALLAVIPVAWVRDDWRWRRKRTIGAEGDALDVVKPLPTRQARTIQTVDPRSKPRRVIEWLVRLRQRAGWYGTVAGLVVSLGLGTWLALMIMNQFTDPLAPWVWLLMLGALALTFAGVKPKDGPLPAMPHDPQEPATEPKVSRLEWLVVGLIMLVAILLRFVNLEGIPVGPYIDESGRALMARAINLGNPIDKLPYSFFGTAWWGVPNLYFWLEAQSLKLFGDNLLGARVIHALAGVGTVWFTYRLGRFAWSPRVGLLAGALITVSDFAIQFSRTAGESTILIFTWIACFYYLYKGIKTQKPLDFVWAGIAGGLCLYSYASGKLLPPFLVLVAAYLVLRWGRKGIKRFLPLTALMGFALVLTFLPNAAFMVAVRPDALTQRSQGVAIWSPQNQQGLQAQYSTNNWGIILPQQFTLTYSAFDVGRERGPFYPTDQPVLPVPWAALWLVGTAYMLYRMGDVRFATLGVWLVAGLAGAALTNDTPTLQRVAGMVPTLALIPAVYADRVLFSLGAIGNKQWAVDKARRIGRVTIPRPLSIVPAGIALALIALLGWQALTFYFGPFAGRQLWLNPAISGRYIEHLDPLKDVAYTYNIPTMFGDPSPQVFLAGNVPTQDYNPSEQIPVIIKPGLTAHFLSYPADAPIPGILKSYYPAGATEVLTSNEGIPYMTAYKVDNSVLTKEQYTIARYTSAAAAGTSIEIAEPRIGTLGDSPDINATLMPPTWIAYPAQAEWNGGIIAPAYGHYVFSLLAPGGGTLEIDGRQLLTAQANAGAAVQIDVALARGVHTLKLSGTLPGADSALELKWGTGGDLFPIGKRFLWSGARGTLLGTSYPSSDPGWFTAQEMPTPSVPPATIRRDGFLSWLSINGPLNGDAFVFCVWRGQLGAPVSGDYSFNVGTDSRAALWIDGQLVGAQNIEGANIAFPANVHLEAGPHRFELRYGATHDNSSLSLLWHKPQDAGQFQLIPPTDFAPAEGGAQPLSEMPGAPPLDPLMVAP